MKRLSHLVASVLVVTTAAFLILDPRQTAVHGPTEPFGLATIAPDTCPPALTGDFAGPWGSQTWLWYASRATLMQDPILACGVSQADETYRLAFESSFPLQRPLSVTLTRTGQRMTISGKRFRRDPWGRYVGYSFWPTWPVVQSTTRTISEAEWRSWIWAVQGFWTERTDLNDEWYGEDGEHLLLEGRLGHLYHFAGQRDVTPLMRSIAEALAALAGMMPIREADYP